MDLSKPSEIRAIAARQGITLTRLRGQHFLIARIPLMAIVDSADLKPDDTVLEVGPGFGTLTRELAARAGGVVAVELDKRFLPVLREAVGEFPNVRIIHGDILRLRTTDYPLPTNYKIVSNLPYGITSEFLWAVMTPPFAKGGVTQWDPPPERLVLTLQREVGERLAARPPRMNLLAVMAQSFGTVEIVRRVSRGSFLPPPRVESAVVRIIRHKDQVRNRPAILRLAKIGFSSPRKKLVGTISRGIRRSVREIEAVFAQSGIDRDARPEVLGVDAWRRLEAAL